VSTWGSGVLDDDELRRRARRLRDLVEPIAANVYFAPEAHAAYAELGLEWSPGYFGSRGACLGEVPGEVVAAAFGVFKPSAVMEAIRVARARATAAQLLAARERGAVAGLERLVGPATTGAAVERATALLQRGAAAAPPGEGRAIYSGLCSLGFPGTPMGDLWRAADLVREHRGDSHLIAWVCAGLTPAEAMVLTELWWRLPLKSYTRTRSWTDEEMDATIEGLRARGLVTGNELTAAGESLRAEIEWHTDRQERPILQAIGDDIEELLALLTPMVDAILAGKGYPGDPRRMTRP
jgi:hypothetical protein